MLPAILLFALTSGRSGADESSIEIRCGSAARAALARAIDSRDADWVVAILEQEQATCGSYEYHFRASVIVALMSGEALPEAGRQEILRHVLDYVERISGRQSGSDPLDTSTTDQARRLRSELTDGSERQLYAVLYSGDFAGFRALLWDAPGPDCPLREALWRHQGALQRAENQARVGAQAQSMGVAKHPGGGLALRIGAGFWMPTGPLAKLGPHLVVDDVIGYYRGRVEISVATRVRFLRPQDPYQIEIDGTGIESRDFFGGNVGAEIGLAVLAYERFAVVMAGGAGLDVFGDETYNFSGIVVNGGLIVRYLFPPETFLFANLRYSRYYYLGGFLDGERHQQHLDGDAYTMVVGLGWML